MIKREDVLEALSNVIETDLNNDIVSSNLIEDFHLLKNILYLLFRQLNFV